ncbi:Jacalin domain-containing protein/LRR_2 domain-containing protein [Cephalotus follicularis]|uniref:Jacalin domain-containing protein/LRR_2 domain-containing protein n=1 Tax=Cephalotus follicularis TaxID=3775 RepID=A0A1Q3CJI9_CEPFO|nr:Jacalin domain-containing protein/LRR_2 domain-containing protein [Cephalotus follicularis]
MTWKRILIQKMLKKKSSTGKQRKMPIDLTDLILQGAGIQKKRKRKGLDPVDESARRKRKQKTMEQKVKPVDQISHLPEHIIHHILSFMRSKKDAVRTSILSKRWGQIWASFSNLEFDQSKFQLQDKIRQLSNGELQENRKRKMFIEYVDNTLQSRIDQKINIQKFKLHLTSYNYEIPISLGRWIGMAADSNIQELDLHFPVKTKRNLPQNIFAVKTITALRVYGCKLGTCTDIKFSRLQKLCLGKLHFDEQMLQNLISSCPLMEDLRLIYCSGLKTFQVSGLSHLIRVDFHHCRGLKDVELQAPDLETFWYHGKKSMCCKINLATCNGLKCLTLEDPNMTDETFQKQISNFPVLNMLVLSKCDALKTITISSYRLTTLILRECKNLTEADIDTPNLLSFEYKGDKMPFTSLNPSSLIEAKLYFDLPQKSKAGFRYSDDDQLWFAKLKEFIGKFKHSKCLKFVVRSFENIIIHEDLREILIPPHYDLKLEVVKPSIELKDLLDKLLRSWHPKTLAIVSSPSSNLPKLVQEKITGRNKETGCCTYNVSHNKCWRHFLKAANTLNLDDSGRASQWVRWLKSSPLAVHKTTCYKLNWKSPEHEGGKDQQHGQKKCIIFVGPWGGNGGTIWDDGTYSGVRGITLNYGDCIDSIRVVYDKNGTPITADKHGGVGGSRAAEIKLQFPEEYLISVSGYYCSYGGSIVIRSLTFKSQRRTFGPFGVEVGTPFTLTTEGGQIVGFKGRSGWYLDSIGFHISRVQSTKLFGKVKKGFQRLAGTVSKSAASKDGEKNLF